PKLIKNISLGGKAIFTDIIANVKTPAMAAIKQAFTKQPLRQVKQTVNVMNIKPKVSEVKLAEAAQPTNLSSQAHTRSTVVTGVQVKKITNTAIANKQSKRQVPADVKHQASKEIFQESATHQAFLNTRQMAGQQISKLIEMQANVSAHTMIEGTTYVSTSTTSAVEPLNERAHAPELSVVSSNVQAANENWANGSGFQIKGPTGYSYPPLQLEERFNKPQEIIWDTADLVEFAEGDIAKVFGDEFKIIDSYSRRVRLPTTDYLLVSRVTELEATVNEYKKSYMCTEYDIPVDAPFLIDGQIPWSVSVESGQCDLLLISYIGIDFQAKGERVYRLLDCELTFLEEMAFGGETLRYEIHIDSYARNGEQLLFFFHYDCYVGDKKVLIMRNGCAGFFTDEELADGKGVILNDKDKAELANAVK
ncbi:MAG TPA: 3-hydroxyacyl-[acyl-carrier-protein] dehydratase FabA, partial [Colwellia sp.]|nr:3-hydroxyacyl-[acyl-carrier-protein] dehydratase FabA [Colwellia sp.]